MIYFLESSIDIDLLDEVIILVRCLLLTVMHH